MHLGVGFRGWLWLGVSPQTTQDRDFYSRDEVCPSCQGWHYDQGLYLLVQQTLPVPKPTQFLGVCKERVWCQVPSTSPFTTTCPPHSPTLTVSTATKLAVFMASRRDGHISLKLSLCTSTTGTWTTSSSSDFVLLLTPPEGKERMDGNAGAVAQGADTKVSRGWGWNAGGQWPLRQEKAPLSSKSLYHRCSTHRPWSEQCLIWGEKAGAFQWFL